tara:strand:- start:577 stop:1068 length:492 start_codon:yes stop_codon:yes gene_type:complete
MTKRVIYVGSSCDFINREKGHKHKCNNENAIGYNLPIYKYIRENGGFENYEIIPVSFHNLNNVVELRILEQQEMDKHTGLMNCVYASRTTKQYNIDNKERIKERDKKYYIDNKDTYKKQYINNKEKLTEKVTCDCGSIVANSGLTRHKKTKKHLDLIAPKITI